MVLEVVGPTTAATSIMSLMDISKIFSLLQPKEGEEEEESREHSQALNQAVSADDLDRLAGLLALDPYRRSVNARSGWGVPVTPLRTAAALGHLRCLELLLAHGAEVDSLDVKAQTPLFAAVSGQHLSCVEALLTAGADPNGSPHNNSSPVLTAARQGDLAVLRALLLSGAEVDVRPKGGPEWASNAMASACGGPLYLSAVYGHLDCFKLLLLHDANPDYNCTDRGLLARVRTPKTVLETCLRHGGGGTAERFVRLLVDFGADVCLPALAVEKTGKENEAVGILLGERVCPKTLMSQTRLAIRRHIPLGDKTGAIDSLDIPQILRNYLNHLT